MRLTVDELHFHLEVFMRENPEGTWHIVVDNTKGGRITATHPKNSGKNIEFEEKEVWTAAQ